MNLVCYNLVSGHSYMYLTEGVTFYFNSITQEWQEPIAVVLIACQLSMTWSDSAETFHARSNIQADKAESRMTLNLMEATSIGLPCSGSKHCQCHLELKRHWKHFEHCECDRDGLNPVAQKLVKGHEKKSPGEGGGGGRLSTEDCWTNQAIQSIWQPKPASGSLCLYLATHAYIKQPIPASDNPCLHQTSQTGIGQPILASGITHACTK